MESMSDSFVTWLRHEIERRKWSLRETARRAGLSHTAVRNALSSAGAPTLDTYRGLSRAFDVPLEDVLRTAEVLPPSVVAQRDQRPMLDAGIRILPELPPGDLAAAVRMLRGLRLTAETHTEVALAPLLEHTFYSGDTPRPRVRDLPPDEQRLYDELFVTLVRLASPGQFETASEWFSRAREAYEEAVGKGG